MCKVSIIIPIYNVEKYLENCLDSVIGQTYSDLEIILVNDGSTDNSGLTAKKYADSEPRCIYLEKKNGGLSDARNYGLRQATGDYIYFLDSDDFIPENAIAQLLSFSIANNCDVTQGSFYYTYDDRLEYDNRYIDCDTKLVLEREQAMDCLLDNRFILNFAWGKLIKKDILHDIEFETGRYFEDSFWKHLVINRCNRYGVLGEPLYYYRQRKDSISGSYSDRIIDLLRGNESRVDFIHRKFPSLYPKAVKNYWRLIYNNCYPLERASKAKKDYLTDAFKTHIDAFNKYLKFDVVYFLCKNNHMRTLKAIKFGKRVHDHFFAKRLKTIRR